MTLVRRTMGRAASLLALGILLLLPGGCAATFQPMGPMTQAAHLTLDTVVTPDGAGLPLRSWLPENGAPAHAVVLALHGFNDYSNAFQATGHYFAAHGIATYAYDQRGFGATVRPGIWPTDETLIADLHTVASLVRGRHPGVPFYLLGKAWAGPS